MKNRTENISVRYRPQHLTKSQNTVTSLLVTVFLLSLDFPASDNDGLDTGRAVVLKFCVSIPDS